MGRRVNRRSPGAGRPPIYEPGQAAKVMVTLLNRQIGLLDRIRADVRAGSGAVVDRGEILRALVDAALSDNVPAFRTEAELWAWIKKRR